MSEKSIQLYVVGEGDPELQAMIEKGLAELGHNCTTTSISNKCETFEILFGQVLIIVMQFPGIPVKTDNSPVRTKPFNIIMIHNDGLNIPD